MTDFPRLIEAAFPLRQASLDSVHEKNVRHGHISTLHIWPARRPLAASRAALLATMLPDPGDPEARRKLVERIGGVVKREDGKEVTVGGVLHWGRENNPDMDFFREEIRKAYGGRAPRFMDPFAGGGAIPLEAMRLGCEVTAVDINPVAWFILKCTLEYPQRLAGQTRPLPAFALQSPEFMERFDKAHGKGKKKGKQQEAYEQSFTQMRQLTADLAWHVRAWGDWVLRHARADLAHFYPSIDNKPTVAYLWARTVTCKNCRATIPLLKTRWLAKKDNKRVVLTMAPNAERTGVEFGIHINIPVEGKTKSQKAAADKRIGGGTMSGTGATCPNCHTTMTKADIRLEGQTQRWDAVMTAVVVDGSHGKEYRLPEEDERTMATEAADHVAAVFTTIPFGLPDEFIGEDSKSSTWCVQYGANQFSKLFTQRQLLALGTFVKHTRAAREAMQQEGYSDEWVEAIGVYLSIAIDRISDRSSNICHWDIGYEKVANTFSSFRLPISWDFVESSPKGNSTGSYFGQIDFIVKFIKHAQQFTNKNLLEIKNVSAINEDNKQIEIIITDPPYYDAIPYSDLMDFFYVWLRRSLHGISPEIDAAFSQPLSPKWDHDKNDGELIDDASRFGGDKAKSKANYEEGMFRAFQACHHALTPEGRLVVVFAHKDPNAWETLVSAIIRAGFVVDGSWPIQTERESRNRALSSAALSSSVWLVCKKRPVGARPGWDTTVLEEMHNKITTALRNFWDDGIRGPDFVWSATGPALEAYSQYPVVKKANDPGATLQVNEFLRHVRRMVVDFAVGHVMHLSEETTELDDLTTYYLLHRQDYGLAEAPIGASILYATSCGVSDSDLSTRHNILARKTANSAVVEENDNEEDEESASESKDNTVKLVPWNKRDAKKLHDDIAIDRVHILMRLWREGDVAKVDGYLDRQGLRRSAIFAHLLQALIELSAEGSEERAILESISNHVGVIHSVREEQMPMM